MRSSRLRRLGCTVLLLAVLAACTDAGSGTEVAPSTAAATTVVTTSAATDSTTTAGNDGLPVIVDTDVAYDDMMALAYLLRRDDVDLIAVTVSGTGVAHCEAGVSVVMGILAVAEASGIPVACGSDVPIEGSNAFPIEWRSAVDRFAASGTLPEGGLPSDAGAADVIAEAAAASETPPLVVVLGPHTNLAQALRDHPELEQQLAGIHLMGGAVFTTGNTFDNPSAEWNLWIDPVADGEVLDTALPVTIVPLDATAHVPLTTWFADRLAEHLVTPEAQMVHDLLMADPTSLTSGASFWDQLAAVAIVEPEVAVWEELDVTVLQSGGPQSAGSIVTGLGRPASVATAADREAFEREFLSTLTGEDVAPSEWDVVATVTIADTGWEYEGPAELGLEPSTILVDNQSESRVVTAQGWLTDDATFEDLEQWDSVEQPPWLEVDGFAFVDPRIQAIWTVEPSRPGDNVLIGLDVTQEQVAWRQMVKVAE